MRPRVLILSSSLLLLGCADKISNEPPPPESGASCAGGLVAGDGTPVKTGDAAVDECIASALAVDAWLRELDEACNAVAGALALPLGDGDPCVELLSALEQQWGTPLPVTCQSFGSCEGLALQCTTSDPSAEAVAEAFQDHGAPLCASVACDDDLLGDLVATQQACTEAITGQTASGAGECVLRAVTLVAEHASTNTVAVQSAASICSGKLE